jgi:hypothetical protein
MIDQDFIFLSTCFLTCKALLEPRTHFGSFFLLLLVYGQLEQLFQSCPSLEEVVLHAGHKFLMCIDYNGLLVVGNPQMISGKQLINLFFLLLH